MDTQPQVQPQDHSQPDVLSIVQRIAPLLSKDQDVQEFAQLVQKAYQIGNAITQPAPAVQP